MRQTIVGIENLPSVTMSLRLTAVTDQSQEFIRYLAKEIGVTNPLPKRLRAIAAIVGDLLTGAAFEPPQLCYRPLEAASFTGFSIGHHSFTEMLKLLLAAGYLTVYRGKAGWKNEKGIATRISCNKKLIDEIKNFGIDVKNYNFHFKDECRDPLVSDPVTLSSSSTYDVKIDHFTGQYTFGKIRGHKLDVDYADKKVAEIEKQVTEINEFLHRQSYQGMNFQGLFRGFNEGVATDYGWNKGGRLYAVGGGYQSIRREDRSRIRINGEPVAEVDIGASHLTILHALVGQPLPNKGDPYEVDGVSRDSVKRFVTITIGNGDVPSQWSTDAAEAYAKGFAKSPVQQLTGELEKDHPFEVVRDSVLKKIPILASLPELGITWADLQYQESEVLIDALLSLIRRRVVCLPLHDSLIGKDKDSSIIYRQITSSFKNRFNVKPIIKIKKAYKIDEKVG